MVKVKSKPTKKQINFAKVLGINNPEDFDRKELALLIEQVLKEKEEKKEEKKEREEQVEEGFEEEKELLIEYPGYTGIQKPIRITIAISDIKEVLQLMKEKRTYKNGPTLFQEFILFLKRVKAKKENGKIIIESNEIYDGPYLRTVIDGFFIPYEWEYIE